MRNQWIGVLGVTLIVAGIATAQPPQRGQRGGGMFGGNRSSPQALLANEDVQKELKLTDEQKEKIKAFAPAQQGRRPGGAGGGQPGQGRGGNPEAAQAAEKFVKESLTAEQQKRFKQIRFQVMGVTAYNEDEVQTALKLTDDQKAKIKTLIDDYTKDRGELMPQRGAGGGGGNFQEILPKLEALAKTYTEKVQAVLTDEQKKAWKDLVGAEFKLQQRRPAADR